MSIYITRNFKWIEFACPCGCGKDRPIDPHFIYLLQNLRDKINQPIYVTTGGGIRCRVYNKRIGGYIDSPHLIGKAADIYVKNMDIVSLAKQARDISFNRIGLYSFSHFIHVDVIRPYLNASWVRDINGNYHYFKTLEDAILFMEEKL